MKFIHAADIHLDSPLCGLARYEGVPAEQMQSATRRAFINLVDLACTEAVDFLLIAGDLYDVDWKDYNTGLFFNQQMSRLREANIPVFIVLGNHDAGNSITKQLRLPDNVKEFSTTHPETVILEKIGVAIHGQSFATKAVTEDLSADYPTAIAGYYNIGLLHTAVNGREGHANYAPCSLQGLLAHGYDYWALGHVHNREVLHEEPFVVFSGNLQGRHVRETGAKGCTLVTVTDHKTTLSHCAVDVLRWAVCSLDVSNVTTADEIVDKAREAVLDTLQTADGRPLALRVVIDGACPAHAELHSNPERWSNDIRAVATDVGLGNVWVEKIHLHTHPINSTRFQDDSPFDELLQTLRTLPQDGDSLLALGSELRHLKQALPMEARFSEYGFDPEDPDTLRQMLNRVEGFLMGRLLAQA
ncbi:metallophosphoesterase family protein [Beggiatoa leptomitoformis]|uniref:DNA repair exonuclease n=1 Tax=Beggiatoa leptomitoformis TaxID=288004 RepID=A0A2N9YA62_9GAMM|nr:DNA repair exonuclease [Beggiatoa leptomitoformis]ALG67234.1 DNA repair exonuclease [Beggiatoa leptomitoformis]AUI67349.1 DNA repair exonuclease [Beggiatoa leptomitoformis]